MAQIHDVLLRPLTTEKGAVLESSENTYVFAVGLKANKIQIKAAVEAFFGVSVEAVRTSVVRGKNKRFGRHSGRRSDWKKAYVKLSSGDVLNFFSDEAQA